MFSRFRQSLAPSGKHYLSDCGLMLASRIVWISTSFGVGISVVRKLGPADYGLVSYITAYVGMFSIIADLGLSTYIQKELIIRRREACLILGNSFMLKVFSVSVMFAAMWLTGYLRKYDENTAAFIWITAAGYIFSPLYVTSCFFTAFTKNKYNAIPQISSCLSYSLIRIYAVISSAPLHLYFLAESAMNAVLFITSFAMYRWKIGSPRDWNFRLSELSALFRAAIPLTVAQIFLDIYMRTDILILNFYRDHSTVACYTISAKFVENIYLLLIAAGRVYSSAVFKAGSISADEYRKALSLYLHTLFLSACIVIPVGLLSGKPIISFLYGQNFSRAADIFMLSLFALPFSALLYACQCHATYEGRLKKLAVIFGSGVVLNLTSDILVVPSWGAYGAAFSSIVSMPAGLVTVLLLTKDG